jgi:hypothetical protein
MEVVVHTGRTWNYLSKTDLIRFLAYYVPGRVIPAYRDISGNVFPFGNGATNFRGGSPDHLRIMAVPVKTAAGADRCILVMHFFIPETDDGPLKGC